jgi:glycosyltransferase involved in cell wall biosynthesis
MDYDIIIATANRPDIFRVSLPSMLRQSRPPKALIIADASDDHATLVRTVRELTAGTPVRVEVFHTSKGAAPQRNAGLAYATSPVIFFPDDDSIWYDDVAENVMRIYERDTDQRIGGVGQAESFESPVRLSQADEQARRGSRFSKLKYLLGAARHRTLNRLVDNPLHVCGLELLARHTPPDWLPELDAEPVERQIGFRMSYRAESVRHHRFDETLHLPRSALEDFELSYAVLHDQLLVEAKTALVYHHRFGGARGGGVESGIQPFLNLCYIVCKHSPPGSQARQAIYPYSRVFLAEAILLRAPTSAFERDKMKGMRRARRAFPYLLESPPEELTERYKKAFDCCLRGVPV